jgi:chemotaxis protein CheD
MIAGLSDVGARNAEFARGFLGREAIPCLSESLGGTQGRRVQFWPSSGRARQMLMEASVLSRDEIEPPCRPLPAGDDVELF